MKTNFRAFVAGLAVCITASAIPLRAQVEEQSQDTIPMAIEKLQSDYSVLSRLKLTGYIQSQFQLADTAGIESFAGGNFPSGIDNRFSVRRGRYKLAYDYSFSQYVIQVDVTEKGVGIKDAYVSFTEPWLQSFALTAGVFDRPFGYEISYSSSVRESPERSRMFQTLFPGERDLGAKLTFQPPKTSRFNFIKVDAGLFSGAGPTVVDFDRYKDFIGHVSLIKNTRDEKLKAGLGLSYYNGGWRQGTRFTYSLTDPLYGFTMDSTTTKTGDKLRREYFGVDAQLVLDLPIGITQLRGEFITGTQPGTDKSSVSPSVQPSTDAYIRNFAGAYAYLIQNIGQTRNQLIFKYDVFDPNTSVSGNQIGLATGLPAGAKATSASDARFSTFGFGWIYRFNSQVKITAYYDWVINETTENIKNSSTLKDLSTDRKDNVFTIRVQYKF
jgi:hypothetical protein